MADWKDLLKEAVEDSDHIDLEHTPSLLVALAIPSVYAFNINFLKDGLKAFDAFTGLRLFFSAALSGVMAGIIAHHIYQANDFSFKVGKDMLPKEKAVGVVLLVTVSVGFAVEIVPETLARSFPYVTIQMAGLVILLSLYYVHLLVRNWKLANEWPHLTAGIALLGGPLLPPVI